MHSADRIEGLDMASREEVDSMGEGSRRKVTLRDIVVAFFILLTSGLVVAILLEGFLAA
ncbi:hypothetical protein ACFL3H_02205 [Gemmatimonadota bacterium]